MFKRYFDCINIFSPEFHGIVEGRTCAKKERASVNFFFPSSISIVWDIHVICLPIISLVRDLGVIFIYRKHVYRFIRKVKN